VLKPAKDGKHWVFVKGVDGRGGSQDNIRQGPVIFSHCSLKALAAAAAHLCDVMHLRPTSFVVSLGGSSSSSSSAAGWAQVMGSIQLLVPLCKSRPLRQFKYAHTGELDEGDGVKVLRAGGRFLRFDG
jgi:hypothetical protein